MQPQFSSSSVPEQQLVAEPMKAPCQGMQPHTPASSAVPEQQLPSLPMSGPPAMMQVHLPLVATPEQQFADAPSSLAVGPMQSDLDDELTVDEPLPVPVPMLGVALVLVGIVVVALGPLERVAVLLELDADVVVCAVVA